VATSRRPWRISSGRDSRRSTARPGKRSPISPEAWSCCRTSRVPGAYPARVDLQSPRSGADPHQGAGGPEAEQAFTGTSCASRWVRPAALQHCGLGPLCPSEGVPYCAEAGEQMFNLAQRVPDPMGLANASMRWGMPCTSTESLAPPAHTWRIASTMPSRIAPCPLNVTNLGVSLSRLAKILWYLGYPDRPCGGAMRPDLPESCLTLTV
jgi:hypothetical protein